MNTRSDTPPLPDYAKLADDLEHAPDAAHAQHLLHSNFRTILTALRTIEHDKKDAERWQAILWRWGSGNITLDCADDGRFRMYVEHAEAADECYLADGPDAAIDLALSEEKEHG